MYSPILVPTLDVGDFISDFVLSTNIVNGPVMSAGNRIIGSRMMRPNYLFLLAHFHNN